MSLDLDRHLVLTRHADLKHRQDGDVLVLPERAIRIGGSGGEILRLCDGERSARGVVGEMQARYPDTPQIESEVTTFLAEMLDLGGLVWVGHESEKHRGEPDRASLTTSGRGDPR
ncbi:MAG: pyrroloquinoline quinone biosynthesis peptide chaperone PqqD [Deltaproteobacteria bacterium]|jgi:pyrroloquinoline quinone biosynthesis protein D|nr:pyrroloquinoline quinone biosynthesis peptide chaperone PqqD [Deltaproteobacteria bacterium]MBW2500349.1 pyrroloquinoline quinone biosynthesis peptide chaperone PqqD [Deltaproteobacteria bacterium]